MTTRLLLSLCIFCILSSLKGQELTTIGEWESHLPHQQGRWVTQDEDDIIYATEWSLFLIDKSDLSIRYLSKVNGLSDTGVETVHYDPLTKT